MNKNIIIQDWGLVEYRQAWDRQEALFKQTVQQIQQTLPTENRLILCEHPHVYTIGKSGDENNLLINHAKLQNIQADFFHTNRGGDITYHGPEQIVGYPIFDLTNFRIGLKSYIEKLEEVIIKTMAHYELKGKRVDKATGVWLDDDKGVRKICAIGVRCSKYVTMHGFAFNINTDLTYFDHINPCGFSDKKSTSLQQELGTGIDMSEVKELLIKQFHHLFKK